jgi:hypothetical protein
MADYLRTLMDGLCSDDQIDLASYMAACSEAERREAAFRAALPARMDEIADMFSEDLPDGMRFKWVTLDA